MQNVSRFPLPRAFWVLTAFFVLLLTVGAAVGALRAGVSDNFIASGCTGSAPPAKCYEWRMGLAGFDAGLAVMDTLSVAFGLMAAFLLARRLIENWRGTSAAEPTVVGRKA